jgi:hypothetical protein
MYLMCPRSYARFVYVKSFAYGLILLEWSLPKDNELQWKLHLTMDTQRHPLMVFNNE